MTVQYNHLNLPKLMTFANGAQSNTIEILYDAAGGKLRKTVKTGATVNYTQDYLGGIEYKDGVREAIYHAEGRIFYTAPTATRYEYSIKDHLGNSRLTFADKNGDGYVQINEEGEWTGTPIPVGYSEVLQENHYYPFGMNMDGPWRMPTGIEKENLYQYNGKELNEDLGLGWSDYGARWYDASVGRWNAIDPLAGKFNLLSTYSYTSNNPLKFIDIEGKEIILSGSKKHKKEFERMLNENAKGVSFTVNKKSGKIETHVTDEDAMKNSIYSSTIYNAATTQDQTITYELIEEQRGSIDSYLTGEVYMKDLSLLDEDSDIQSALIAHFTAERFGTEDYEKERYNILAGNKFSGKFDDIYNKASDVRSGVINELNGTDYELADTKKGKLDGGNSVTVFISQSKSGKGTLSVAFIQNAKGRLIGIDIIDANRRVSRQKDK